MKRFAILPWALLGLLAFGCGSESTPEETPSEGMEAPDEGATALSADNAGDVADALSPLVASLEGDGMTVYSVGAGLCWSGEGVCAQVEAQTGADEAAIRDAVTDALADAGYAGPIEVRTFDTNPRQPEVN